MIGEIPQRAVAARIKQRVILVGVDFIKPRGIRKRGLSLMIFTKTSGVGGLRVRRVAFRIERWLAALRRGERHVDPRVAKHKVRRRKLFQPEAGLFPGITQFVVGSQYHQNLHRALLVVYRKS